MSKLVAAFASSHSVMLPGYRTPALTGPGWALRSGNLPPPYDRARTFVGPRL